MPPPKKMEETFFAFEFLENQSNSLKRKLNFAKNYYDSNTNNKSINYSKWGTFFLETSKEKMFLSDYLGNFYFLQIEEIFKTELKSLNLNKIKNIINI